MKLLDEFLLDLLSINGESLASFMVIHVESAGFWFASLRMHLALRRLEERGLVKRRAGVARDAVYYRLADQSARFLENV